MALHEKAGHHSPMTDQTLQIVPEDAPSSERAYLTVLGERVRGLRALRGMTRKILARDSGVSERYLAQLESGQGNVSILLLRQLAQALDTPLEALVRDGPEPPPELARVSELLSRLSPEGLAKAHRWLAEEFDGREAGDRRNRIALIGLRGAGKSTLGAALSSRLEAPFVELDREIEREAGAPLNAIFELYGQVGFRKLERRCLERIIEAHPRVVLATGGGLVSDAATFERLLSCCFTVWVRASPAEHMQRVIAQGDMRPMSRNREAMADLQRILREREPLYGRADIQVDTTRLSQELATEQILAALR